MWKKMLLCLASFFNSSNTPDTRPSCTSSNAASLFEASHHDEIRFIRDVLVDLAYEIQVKLKLSERNVLCIQLAKIPTRTGSCFSEKTEIRRFAEKSESTAKKIENAAIKMIDYLVEKAPAPGLNSLEDQLYYSIVIQRAIDRLVTAEHYKEDDKFISSSLFLKLKLTFSPGIMEDVDFTMWVLNNPEPVIVLYYDPRYSRESKKFAEKVEALIYNVEERFRVPLAKVGHVPKIKVFQKRKELEEFAVTDTAEEGQLEKVINTFVALKAEKMNVYYKIK